MKRENLCVKVLSLFSGIGGIDLGFMQAGFEVVWANEIDRDACITYKVNFPEANLIEGDIRNISANVLPDFDVLVAGFPCQPFSLAGKQRGFNDRRGNLFFEISRIVDVKRPRVVFLENVANLIVHDRGKTFLVIYNSLAQFGYAVRYAVMDSKDYGNVPQGRKRVYIVAFLDYEQCKRFKYPEKMELTNTLSCILQRDVRHDDFYYYDEKSRYFNDLVKIVKDKEAVYRIFDYGISKEGFKVCPTLTATMGTMKDRIPIILDDFGIRKLTAYECLALQGFPKGFIFKGISLYSAYKQIGNSVVVPLINRIAIKIKESFCIQ